MSRQSIFRTGRMHLTGSPMYLIFIFGTIAILLTSVLGTWAVISHAAEPLTSIAGSVPPQVAQAQQVGQYSSINGSSSMPMSIGVVLAPDHESQIQGLVKGIYDRHSPLFHHWLQTGEYDKLFGPTPQQLASVQSYLQQNGLTISANPPSSTIVMASGSSTQVEAAFHVTINNYRLPDGTTFYANSNPIQVPQSLSGLILYVFGLDNLSLQQPVSLSSTQSSTSPTNAHPNYGGGPLGSGLTPSQIDSLYDALPVYNNLHNKGKGRVIGLAEFSAYTPGDITTYEHQYGLPNAKIQKIAVPKTTGTLDHKGALEVELDIDMVLALAPQITTILVYQAPNLGRNTLLMYQKIATDNKADAVSISWGNCEASISSAFAQAENKIFQQMAMQAQSVFAASGDSGAFDCGSSNKSLQVDNPASQPYVTGVGGTSFAGFDPGSNPTPAYPQGAEHAWTDGGGGVSRIWSQPAYQAGPGVNELSYSQSGSWCGQPSGTYCREVPDVSLDADGNSGYSIYCTDAKACPLGHTLPLLFGWGTARGTSAGAPLWSAIAVLADNYNHQRLGLLNPLLYSFDGSSNYTSVFHDIQSGNNQDYPAGPNYDMATGMGTPDIYNLITETPIVLGTGGNIWVTGHDADYHCAIENASCHYLQVALTFVSNGSTLPVLALDHGTLVSQAISSAFGSSAPIVDTVDPRTGFGSLPLIDSNGLPLYSAIVVASDITCGGCDNNNDFGDTPDTDAINARAADIAQFLDAGGGILALAGADNYGVFYNFLPVPVTAATVTPPFTFTTYGLSLGLVEGTDDNCCATHNSFNLPPSGGVYQVAETDGAGLAETLVASSVLVAPALQHKSGTKPTGSSPHVPQN